MDYFELDSIIAEEFLQEYASDFIYSQEGGYMFNTDYEIGDFSEYDVFDEELFNRLMTGATKYIGYSYVWGGSNTITSFDCS